MTMTVRKIAAAILVLPILASLTGCKEEKAVKTVTQPTEITAVTVVPETLHQTEATQMVQEWISQEQAMIQGFVVVQDGDVRHNQDRWQAYMDAAETKIPASVTVIHFGRSETGSEQNRYDLSFDGSIHHLTCVVNGKKTEKNYAQLLKQQISLEEEWEPYDSVIRYLLADGDRTEVLFEDFIAETDFAGVYVMGLYLKEGEPPLLHAGEPSQVEAILSLLSHAEYLSGDPSDYYYGAKLMMTNGKGKQLVLELDLNKGNYRYGMQTYRYGEVTDLLNLLGLDKWPDEVYAEHGAYIN